eukprot:TRINITY_DN4682_c0_g1_i3.p1 TRINITY_DN4682_c0_g1~~TRINITY_DN4682_c0_g1_i3.p1  ORF type:complete len:260 (-),score=11.89 TRINITY_DN4682_c0_g1_i3:92-871(-)
MALYRFLSWNVNGIRSVLKKGQFVETIKRENPNILCLQEVRALPDQVDLTSLSEYTAIWNPAYSDKKGYSGTMILSKITPKKVTLGIGIPEHDKEGRFIQCEFDNFTLLNIYSPTSQHGLKRLPYRLKWEDDLFEFIKNLKQISTKPIIIGGDLNVAHTELDVAFPEQYRNTYSFTDEERGCFSRLLNLGYCDTYRYFNNNKIEYTYWNPRINGRARNRGWRVDYFCCDNSLIDKLKRSWILKEVYGSDHCPIGLEIEL